eukprot:gene25832-11508_t
MPDYGDDNAEEAYMELNGLGALALGANQKGNAKASHGPDAEEKAMLQSKGPPPPRNPLHHTYGYVAAGAGNR